jgi:hypothetical protein
MTALSAHIAMSNVILNVSYLKGLDAPINSLAR